MAMQSGLVYGKVIFGHAKQILYRSCSKRVGQLSLRLITAYCGFPKFNHSQEPKRKFIYGEDAFFIAENKNCTALGVADGVGGWRDYGIDASKFSTTLMRKCEHFVNDGGLTKLPTASEVLHEGYKELALEKPANFGSSTACVMVFDKQNGILNSANLGDSGFIVYRDRKILHRSTEQQHYFNTPFQLALPPPKQENIVIQDSIASADVLSIDVEEGDIIVVGTDGLFDNLPIQQISRGILQLKDTTKESLQFLANSLAGKAFRLSSDQNYMSPFAVNARREGIAITGGKPDDITVIVSTISSKADFSV